MGATYFLLYGLSMRAYCLRTLASFLVTGGRSDKLIGLTELSKL